MSAGIKTWLIISVLVMPLSKKTPKAQIVDKLELYEESVQYAPDDREFIEKAYNKIFRRSAISLREDFCGSGWLVCDWVNSGRGRYGIGVDLDGQTLDWGRSKHLATLSAQKRLRVKLLQSDVLTVRTDAVDVIAALNFSYCIFKDRSTLLRYFTHAYRSLNKNGLLVLDVFGGTESAEVKVEESKRRGFTYVWDQSAYNPLTGELTAKIHFQFPDGSSIKDAFVYDWRLWRTPELIDLLKEAGFRMVKIYAREDEAESGTGGELTELTSLHDDLVWLAYIVAVKS